MGEGGRETAVDASKEFDHKRYIPVRKEETGAWYRRRKLFLGFKCTVLPLGKNAPQLCKSAYQ